MEESRELAVGFEEAVGQAMAEIGAPPDQASEANDEDDGTREASAPPAPQLRAVKDEPEEAKPAQPERAVDPKQERLVSRAQKYGEFLDDIENNAALRKHIESFWAPKDEAPKQAADDDPLAEYDEKDRSALSKLLERHEQKMLSRFDEALAPFREQMAAQHATQEFSVLDKEHPDWKTHASKEDLAEVRKQFPGLTLLAAYRMTGLPKELAAVRAHVTNADRQVAKVGEVLKRKHPAESTPRRHVKVEKPALSFEDGFELAYARAKAAFGTPGR